MDIGFWSKRQFISLFILPVKMHCLFLCLNILELYVLLISKHSFMFCPVSECFDKELYFCYNCNVKVYLRSRKVT